MVKYFSIALTLLFISSNAFAGSYYRDRTITGVGIYYVGDESVLLIDISGAKTGIPACANSKRLAINSSAPHYKEMVSIAMAANVSGQKTVDIYVTDTCRYYGNAQDILGIKMGIMSW